LLPERREVAGGDEVLADEVVEVFKSIGDVRR
jgi:hypothetical protein